jgi:hypothetical protein
MSHRLSYARIIGSVTIDRPEEKINPWCAAAYNLAADDRWPSSEKNLAAHGPNPLFSPGRLIGSMIFGLLNASLQINNYCEAFLIIHSRPQLHKSTQLTKLHQENR